MRQVTIRRWIGTVATLGAFAYLNLRNWCQPGWCGRFGFPLTYRAWSDEIPDFNGKITGGPTFSMSALSADIVIALAVALAISLGVGWPRWRNQHAA
jgi:hypothetical protein